MPSAGRGGRPSRPTQTADPVPTRATGTERRIGAVIVAGVEAADTPDPEAFLAALAGAPLRPGARDPVHRGDRGRRCGPAGRAVITEKSGTLLDWEGRARPFGQVMRDSTAITDARALSLVARAMGRPLGSIEVADLRAELAGMGRGGARAPKRSPPTSPPPRFPRPGWSSSPPGGPCSTTPSCNAVSPHRPARPGRKWSGSRRPGPSHSGWPRATRSQCQCGPRVASQRHWWSPMWPTALSWSQG